MSSWAECWPPCGCRSAWRHDIGSNGSKLACGAKMSTHTETVPKKILVVDIGGSGLKILATGESEPRRAKSHPMLTPQEMVTIVQKLAGDWEYQAVSIGYPGQVGPHGPRSEPGNL